MPRSRSRRRGRSSTRRSPTRQRRSPHGSVGGCDGDDDGCHYRLELLRGRHQPALPTFDLLVEDEDGERVVSHVCSNGGQGYAIRVCNGSDQHIACAITVDGENALLKDGSLIVAPDDSRELQGFLISKNFVGREYVKEYRDFVFGRPKVVEASASASTEEVPYQTYGRVICEVFEAVLDEEVGSDQELRGQTSFYRGAGLHGSFDERVVPEGKKKHILYSAVTVQGPRSSIANSTRGRWWIRGTRKLRTLEVRYREAHSLMLLGVSTKMLGIARVKDEDGASFGAKKEEDDEQAAKVVPNGQVEVCDLTTDSSESGAVWTLKEAPRQAAPVDVADTAAT